ncbi:hypothetical protein BD324DRAFT_652754 [Kockovaella imperatae]|uniref:Csf1 N-terminal domain-containing protein n=1 Tax=Kockovaella imperatae TaxID=4999 RepID=A0A1Y1UBX5_9TREE|nr:hypothetical protein BD324DRAFT_652754 [Kockovaella imperatae]ORX35037.1 hypothetical protein BD324DRAFT_652754 [Kockovaella imperatae]
MGDDPINFLLLVELIVVTIVCSAFLFYWNRLFGWVFAWCIRQYTWRRYNAYIAIESLQISPLAGRIAFRQLDYHSSNISFRALHGHVTFRYWKLRVRQEADSQSTNRKRNRLPCRIRIYAEGVEGFVFNRTPAYDGIVERMKQYEHAQKATDSSKDGDPLHQKDSRGSGSGVDTSNGDANLKARLRRAAKAATNGQTSSGDSRSSDSSKESPDKPNDTRHELPKAPKPVQTPVIEGVDWFREMLPIDIRIVTGSIILGNDATPMLLIGDFQSATGTLEISDSRSSCDLYKMSVNLRFDAPKILMRTNVDYSGPLLAHGKKAYDELYKKEPDVAKQPPSKLSSSSYFQSLARKFSFLQNPRFSSPPVVGLPQDRVWKGLARYRLDEGSAHKAATKEEREYAKVTTLLDSPALDLTYYADSPGPVPDPSEAETIDQLDEFGNIEPAPEYGIDISVHGGILQYGPWADRQRDALQKAFAPAIFFHSQAKPTLKVGETRVHTNLLLNLSLTEETTLRIPTREPSKDWSYDNAGPELERPYGWLDVVVGPNSSITYTQSQLATEHGYDSMLILNLDALTIASSVNLETFVMSRSCRVSVTMPTPLRWDAQRDWGLDIALDSPDVTLLRDHIQLISDVARDWSSGALGDFHHFVPNHYNFRITLINYAFHLYINDFNIVNRPRSREDNAFMDVIGPAMSGYVAVSATQYRPEFSVVPFSVKAHDTRIMLCTPVWDTHRSFGTGESIEIGKIGTLEASGNYRYYAVPKSDHQELLNLHLEASKVVYKMLGWSLRRLFCVKDNYFGGFTQFTTMQEYLERFDHDPDSVGDPVEEKYRPGRSDSFAAQITMNVEDSLILLSDQIYGCQSGLAMPLPQLQMALRSTEHYLDLSLDASPTYIVPMPDFAKTYTTGAALAPAERDTFFIEGIEVKAHRLFGPQPRAETYVCIWEINAPRITAFSSPTLQSTLQSVRNAVIYTFSDFENAPAEIYMPKTPPDVTFLKMALGEVAVTVFDHDSALSVHIPEGVNINTTTWATRSFQAAIAVVVPDIQVLLLSRQEDDEWTTMSSIRSDICINVFNVGSGWRDKVERQQAFLQKEDKPTGRIAFLYSDEPMTVRAHAGIHHLPNPWISPDDWETDTASQMTTESSSSALSSSSMGSGTDEGDAQRMLRPRNRVRSWATARNTPHVSDTTSDTSEGTSEGTSSRTSNSDLKRGHQHDLPTALAATLDQLRQFHNALPVPDEKEESKDDVSDPFSTARLGMPQGRLVRILVNKIHFNVVLNAAPVAFRLFTALRRLSDSPERLFDNLLIQQVKPIYEIVKAESVVIDATVPHILARFSFDKSSPRAVGVDIGITGIRARTFKDVQSFTEKVPMNVTLAARSIQLTVSSARRLNKPYLDDSALPKLASAQPNKVLSLIIDKPQASITPSENRVATHQHYADIDITVADSAFDVLTGCIESVKLVKTEITADGAGHRPYANLLYHIYRAAEESDITLTAPTFISETAYGLHVQDQRSIRRDLGWMLLAKLRHWYRLTGPASLGPSDVSPEDMAREVVHGLALVEELADGENALILRQSFIQHAFGTILPSQVNAEDKVELRSSTHTLHIGAMSLRHLGHTLKGQNAAPNLVRITSTSVGIHRTKPRQESRSAHTRLLVAVKNSQIDVSDSLLSLADSVKPLSELAAQSKPSEADRPDASRNLVCDLQVDEAQFLAAAAGLKTRITLNKHQSILTSRIDFNPGEDGPARHEQMLLIVDTSKAEMAVLQPQTDSTDGNEERDRMVISLGATDHRVVVENHIHFDSSRPKSVKVMMGLSHFEVDSRPQLRAFLAFAKDWKSEHEPTYAKYFRRGSKAVPNDVRTKSGPDCSKTLSPNTVTQVDLSVRSGQVQVRAAKSVWIRWDLDKIFLTGRCADGTVKFGTRIAPQHVGAYASIKKTRHHSGATLRLPSVSATGTFRFLEREPQLSTSVQLGFFTGIIKPAMLDRLLSLHQRLARDMEQLFKEYSSRSEAPLSTQPSSLASRGSPADVLTDPPESRLPMRLDIRCGVEGIRFGLRADDVATTLLFEALALTAQASNIHDEEASLSWRAKVNHFGLSLGHLGTGALSVEAEPMRKHRSAYMVVDVDVQEIPGTGASATQLNIYLNRAHTVMHVAALSELSDLVKSWQSDLHILRDNRASEMAEIKSTTSKFLKKLDPGEGQTKPENSWFASRLLSVHVAGLGLAIPLTDAASIGTNGKNSIQHDLPALLFSIRTIAFINRKNETARFKVQRIALQMVSKFDQGVSEHFSGDFHTSSNRMSLPSLESEAEMASTEDTWMLSAHCAATDFKLSLAPDIADGIFKLTDLYSQGRDRFFDLERHYRTEVATAAERSDSVAVKYEEETVPTSPRKRQRIFIRMSYTFNSGIVELHHAGHTEPQKAPKRHLWLDIFHLPAISLWVDYAEAQADTSPHSELEESEANASNLVFSFAVHESRNTLRPSILPFFVELANRVQRRVQEKNERSARDTPKEPKKPISEPLATAISESTLQKIAPTSNALRIKLSLRIDRSELRFSCAPDSNAYADLKWESGGFVVTTTLGKPGVSTVSGSISDITSSLSNEFAERGNNCVEAGAKDMAFAITLCPGEGAKQSALSVVFDTQLMGQFRLDAFNSWLVFVAVWVNDAPKLDLLDKLDEAQDSVIDLPTTPLPESQPAGHRRARPNKMAVAILARFRSIDFDANIGVSRAHLLISPIVIRSISNGERTEIDFEIGTTKISALGDISGDLTSESLVFRTMRRSSRSGISPSSTILSMSIEGGDLEGSLFLADTNILRFHLEPSQVSLTDDWHAYSRDPASQVFLSFTVQAGLFQGVLRLLSIPRLLGNMYSVIDMAESQSVIAAQRSETFKKARSRRQTELQPMAAVILQTAAKKVNDKIPSSTVKTAQTMRFDLAGIDIGVFNEDFENGHVYDFYRFIVGKVEADLKRQLSKENLPMRDLGLLVAAIRWDYCDGARVAALETVHMTAGDMIEAATKVGKSEVASLPVMTLVMNSIEYNMPRILDFDFDLTWGETDGDIRILPDFFEQAKLAVNKLIQGLDEQEITRSRSATATDTTTSNSVAAKKGKEETAVEDKVKERAIIYKDRDPLKADRVPVPRLKMLGAGTNDAAKMVPAIRAALRALPSYSHRFVTTPLEEGMDLLLKLYEKQLPETT